MSKEIHHRITGHTELLALIAYPIRHSESPRMHNLASSRLGLDYAYLAFEVEQLHLKQIIDTFRVLKVRGWNVSMPNKASVIQYLDEIDESIDLTGACNTVVNDDGVLRGYNTDGQGWIAALKENNLDVRGATITVIGAGATARAIVAQAAIGGAAKIHVFNRRDQFYRLGQDSIAKIIQRTNATAILRDLGECRAFADAVAESSLLANATNVGTGHLQGISPLPEPGVLRQDLFVSDVIYAPPKSKLLEQAQAAGCRCVNGLSMMYNQGAASFKLFTNRDMPLEYVRKQMAG